MMPDTLPEEIRNPRFTDFDVQQLRSLIFAYQKSPEDIPRSRTDLLRSLDELRNHEIELLLTKLEFTQVYKHSYLFRLGSDPSHATIAELLTKWVDSSKYKKFGETNLFPLDIHNAEYLSLRCVQPIIHCSYEQQNDESTYKLTRHTLRHVVIIAIKPKLGIVEVRFDGFEQSKITPASDRIDYSRIANDCRLQVQTIINTSVDELLLRSSIEKMLAIYSDEVAQIGTRSRFKYGTIAIEADEGADGNLNDFLAEAFPGVTSSISVTGNWANKKMMLKWPKIKMATRINLVGHTSDVLFMWRQGATKTLATSDHIIKRLVEYSDTEFGNEHLRLQEGLLRLKSWDVFTPSDLSHFSNVAMPNALEFLLEKVALGETTLQYRYRVTQPLNESDNAWVGNLWALPNKVTTISGEPLESRDPKNIEVGFSFIERPN